MGKYARPGTARRKRSAEGTPLVVLMWAGGLGILGYLIGGEILLATRPHPLHWAAGLVGGIVGYLVGWIWFQRRGDIV